MNSILLKHYNSQAKAKNWKGHRLVAGDGSTLNLVGSKKIKDHFGVHSKTKDGLERTSANIFFLYDALNDFVIDYQLANKEKGEVTLMKQALKRLSEDANRVLILDRLYGNYCHIKPVIDSGNKFCIRLNGCSGFAKRMLKKPENDITCDWVPSAKEKENARKAKLKIKPIKVRVLKVELDSGETEILATNLFDQQTYSHADFKALYHKRWAVEECFKKLKAKMKIEHFSCRRPEGIYQEFYAHVFCMNLVSLVGQCAQDMIATKTGERRWKYKFNWSNAYKFVRRKMGRFLSLKWIHRLIKELVEDISSSLVAIKPDRSFIRDNRHRKKSILRGPYYK